MLPATLVTVDRHTVTQNAAELPLSHQGVPVIETDVRPDRNTVTQDTAELPLSHQGVAVIETDVRH